MLFWQINSQHLGFLDLITVLLEYLFTRYPSFLLCSVYFVHCHHHELTKCHWNPLPSAQLSSAVTALAPWQSVKWSNAIKSVKNKLPFHVRNKLHNCTFKVNPHYFKFILFENIFVFWRNLKIDIFSILQ